MSQLVVSQSPHIHARITTRRIMLDVLISLLPSLIAGAVIFGWRSLAVVAVCVSFAIGAEALFNLCAKKKQTVGDLSAAITGLILALTLRADAPLWQCAIGSVFAIIVVKCLFGGLGCNFANPACTGRVALLVCFSGSLAGGAIPKIAGFSANSAKIITGATPLEAFASGKPTPEILDLFFGIHGGAIGETCVAAILIGFVYLIIRGVIKPDVPIIYVGTVFFFTMAVTGSADAAVLHVLTGGLMFGAVFMATDYVTSPVTRTGRMIFAFGCGLITSLIRLFGSYPEGVSFAILFMNILSPYIEKWTAKIPLGGKVK